MLFQLQVRFKKSSPKDPPTAVDNYTVKKFCYQYPQISAYFTLQQPFWSLTSYSETSPPNDLKIALTTTVPKVLNIFVTSVPECQKLVPFIPQPAFHFLALLHCQQSSQQSKFVPRLSSVVFPSSVRPCRNYLSN